MLWHIYQHKWRMGDMLIYDNAQFLHKPDAYEGIRFLKATRLYLSPKRFAVPDSSNNCPILLPIFPDKSLFIWYNYSVKSENMWVVVQRAEPSPPLARFVTSPTLMCSRI